MRAHLKIALAVNVCLSVSVRASECACCGVVEGIALELDNEFRFLPYLLPSCLSHCFIQMVMAA